MEWLGHAKIEFTHSPVPVNLTTKDGSSTDLVRICEASTPPCRLNPLLFNGHLQTCWTAIKDDGPPIFYKRRLFENEDPAYQGSFAVDFVVHEPYSEKDDSLPTRTTYYSDEEFSEIASLDSRPMLVTLHGLTGGSHEVYLKHVLEPLVGADHVSNWEACVINSRGCANHKITSSVLFNARATWDVRQMVLWLRKTFPNRPLFGIGFSLGANILTNYIAEEGDACMLKAAVACSSPWNLEASNLALQRTFLGRNVYSRTMANNLKKLFELQYDQASKIPTIDIEKVRAAKYIYTFDAEVQTASWGYPTVGAYYRDASSTDSVLAIRIPFFAISALDDPVVSAESLPIEEIKKNPYTVLCTTSLGGHLSWFEIGGSRWHARPCVNFLNKMAFGIEVDSIDIADAKASADLSPPRPKFNPMARKWR